MVVKQLTQGSAAFPVLHRRGSVGTRDKLSLVAELAAAGVALMLFIYTSILQATLRLLYCVPVPSQDANVPLSRLFLHGATQCDTSGWQAPLFLILIALLAFPVLLYKFAGVVRREMEMGNKHFVIINANMCSVYLDRYYWWDSVQLTQRLLLSTIATFANTQPLIRSVLTTMVCLVSLVVHMVYRPFRTQKATQMQVAYQV